MCEQPGLLWSQWIEKWVNDVAVNNTAINLCEEEVTPRTQVDSQIDSKWLSHSEISTVRANMSIDGTKLLFEGFLQKRKDTMVS